ncbi:MAG: rod shape-determining protein MreC, partial [Emcibacteraceae bacterium]|nr:rod shape-determining protein MreC [Emcibacteraceae bacterium]
GSASRVLLLSDINSRIPVKFAETGVNVILAGDNSELQQVEFMPTDEIANVGDQIVTSGMGGIFPPDLPVGEVSEITDFGAIKIQPSVNLNRLNYVSVIEYEIASFPTLIEQDTAPEIEEQQ